MPNWVITDYQATAVVSIAVKSPFFFRSQHNDFLLQNCCEWTCMHVVKVRGYARSYGSQDIRGGLIPGKCDLLTDWQDKLSAIVRTHVRSWLCGHDIFSLFFANSSRMLYPLPSVRPKLENVFCCLQSSPIIFDMFPVFYCKFQIYPPPQFYFKE